MSLQSFSEQGRRVTPSTQPSLISDFIRTKTPIDTIGVLPISTLPPKEQKKKKTLWQWIGKQLMKPVGTVAAETEALGLAIRDKKLYIPGKQALKVLTGEREYSFSKLWNQYGADAGISPKVATAIGLTLDFAEDPLLWVGGGMTKLGKVAQKVSSLAKAGKTVSKTSKIGKYITKMGYSVDDLALAGTKLEQVAKGQRAFLKIAGKPILKGTAFYKATARLKQITKATKVYSGVAKVFTRKTGIKHLDEMVDNFRNLSNYRKQQVIDKSLDIQKRMKGMGAEDIKMIAEAIENPAVKYTIKNKKLVKLADEIDNLFVGMKKVEKKVGVLKTELEKYFPHIKAKESLKTRLATFFNPKKYSQVLGSAKHRKISGTVREINARFGKEFFETNPTLAYAQRGLASSKAVTAKEFLDEVGKKFFVNAENAPLGYIKSTNPLFKGLEASKEVIGVVDQYMQGIKPDDLKLIIRAYDRTLSWWKAQVLISPSYHIRNMFSNFWNNWLAGVKNPVRYAQGRKIQSGKGLEKMKILTDAGDNISGNIIRKEGMKRGVSGRGWYGADIAKELATEIGGTSKRARILGKLMPWKQENILFKTNRAIGTAIEDNARWAHFIDKIQKGFSFDDAARSVKKFLFDYADLTVTEKNIFKRVFPFYTWTRKNIPLQLEQLIVQPEKYAAIPKIIQAIESKTPAPKSEKYLSQYIKENIPVRIGTDKKGNTQYFLMGNWLPAAQAVDVLSQPIDNMIQMLTPFVKTPIEIWANKSLFFKNTLGEASKIEYYYKQPTEFIGITMRRKTATLIRNIRILNDLNKLIQTPAKDEPENTWVVKFLNVFFGRAGTYDIKKSRYFYQRETEERVNQLKAAIKKARKLGDIEHVRKLQEELKDFQRERSK